MKTSALFNRNTLSEKNQIPAFPLIEINLNGTLPFDVLLDELAINLNGLYKLIQVELEFRENKNFGKILLSLFSKPIEHELFLQFLYQSNIDYEIVGEGQAPTQNQNIFQQKVTAGSSQLKIKKV